MTLEIKDPRFQQYKSDVQQIAGKRLTPYEVAAIMDIIRQAYATGCNDAQQKQN